MATVAQPQILHKQRSAAADSLPSILAYTAKSKEQERERDRAARMSQAILTILEQTGTEKTETANWGSGIELPSIQVEEKPAVPDRVKAASIFHRLVPDANPNEMRQVSTYLDEVFADRRASREQENFQKAAVGQGLDVDFGKSPLAGESQRALVSQAGSQAGRRDEANRKINEGLLLLKHIDDPEVRASLKGASVDTIKPILQEQIAAKRQAAAEAGRDDRLGRNLEAQADRQEKALQAMQDRLDQRLEQQQKQFEERETRREGANQFDQAVNARWSRLKAIDPNTRREDAVLVERNWKSIEDGLSKEFGKQIQGGLFEILENQKVPYSIALSMAERRLAKGGTVGEAITESARDARIAVSQGRIVPTSVWILNNEDALKAYLVEDRGMTPSSADLQISEWKKTGVYRAKVNAAVGSGR